MNQTVLTSLFPEMNQLRTQTAEAASQVEDAVKAHLIMQAALVVLGITIVAFMAKKN